MPGFRWPRLRFSLRTLLLGWALILPLVGWLANLKFAAMRHRSAVAELSACGYWVNADEAPPPTWLTDFCRNYVDQDAFSTVSFVTALDESAIKPENVLLLSQLQGLRDVRLRSSASIRRCGFPEKVLLRSDDLKRLAGIRTLASITVDGRYTAAATLAVASLPELHSLEMPDSQFTDEVLFALRKRKHLSAIDFDARLITENGLSQLAQLPVLETLTLRSLSDAPQLLESLLEIQSLATLKITDSQLTLADAELIQRLSIRSLYICDCEIEHGFFSHLRDARAIERIFVFSGEKRHFELERTLAALAYCDDHFALANADNSPTSSPSTP